MRLVQEAEGLSAAGKAEPTVPGALLAHATAWDAVGAAVTAAAIAVLARAFSIAR